MENIRKAKLIYKQNLNIIWHNLIDHIITKLK